MLVVEAAIALTLGRLLVLLLPFRRTASLLGELNRETPEAFGVDAVKARRISKILHRISYFLPWRSMCFEQALAGMIMLKLRGIDGTIYFGVQKKNTQMTAHAWLRSGNQIVTGANGRENFTVVFTVATQSAKQAALSTH